MGALDSDAGGFSIELRPPSCFRLLAYGKWRMENGEFKI